MTNYFFQVSDMGDGTYFLAVKLENSSIIEICSDMQTKKTFLPIGHHLIKVKLSCSILYGDKILPAGSQEENQSIEKTVNLNIFKNFNMSNIMQQKTELMAQQIENSNFQFDSWNDKMLHIAIVAKKEEEMEVLIEKNQEEMEVLREKNQEEFDEIADLIEKNTALSKKHEEDFDLWKEEETKTDLINVLIIAASFPMSIALCLFFLFLILRCTKLGNRDARPIERV